MLPTLKRKMEGDIVKVAQILMEYSNTNGEFDAQFETYVNSWQLKNNLYADGIIGAKTWLKIAQSAPTVSTSKLRSSKYAQAVQFLVNAQPDGIFGQKTKAAVAAFQTAAGLTADGIVGRKTWTALICGTDEASGAGKVLNTCVHYLQWDKRWKSVMYSNHNDKGQTIGNSGCGPSSMAMIMATWIDSEITPVEMCELALQGGYRTYESGTGWGFFGYVASKYQEFDSFVKTANLATALAAVRDGALVVCSMNSNDNHFWTKGGHFIVLRGCDDKYIYASDPNKSENPRKQTQAKFKNCLKQAFIFKKKGA